MRQQGFTLIELLVVIAVIGMLASIVLVSLGPVRGKARDGQREQDLNTIQTALEIYYGNREKYPPGELIWDLSIGNGGGSASFPTQAQSYWDASSDLQNLVNEGILQKIPVDPINNLTYYYDYDPDTPGQPSVEPPLKCVKNTCRWKLCANKLESTGAPKCLNSAEQSP